jgi:hypothetical protein
LDTPCFSDAGLAGSARFRRRSVIRDVRPMRAVSTFPLLGIAAFALAACTTFRVAGAPTFGRIHDMPVSEIEAAVAAYQKLHYRTVGNIQVISHDEIRIYWKGALSNYDTMKRVDGRWVHLGGAVVVQ